MDPPSFNLFRRRSIARDLAFGLTCIVILMTLFLSFFYQMLSSKKLARDVEIKAEEVMSEAGEMFFLPLYNFDNQTLHHIARVYLDGTDFVRGITVKNEYGDVLIDEINGSTDTLIRKNKVLTAKNREIGTVTFYFSDQKLRVQQREKITAGFIVIIVLLMVILVAIDLFMHLWLTKPLQLLTVGIRRIAGGDYTQPLPPAPQLEINEIIEEVNTMAGRIAEQKKQLEDSEKRYRSIFEGSMEGIFQETLAGTLLTANPAMANIFGYNSPEECIARCTDTGRDLWVHGDQRRKLIKELGQHGFVTNLHAEMHHKNGGILTIALTVRLVRDKDDRPDYIEGMLSDITGRQQMEDDLRQAQKMEAIGTLAGGIAHDFNNILSAMFGYIELAQMRVGDNIKLKKYLAASLTAARRARDLVQQILTFSRKADQQKKPFPLAVIVKEACKLLRSSIPATVEITKDLQSKAVILADPTQIHQLVMNLCTNSYQAMEGSGGTLSIHLYDKEIQDDHDSSDPEQLPPGMYAVLEVTDTGCGMDEAVRGKIFEPYFTTKSQEKGTGLGLALVHGIVSNCKGKIEVSSTPGSGTAFRIFLPAIDRQAGPQVVDVVSSVPRGKGQTIMLVDDEEPVRDIMKNFLEESGYIVLSYSSGREILDALKAGPETCDLLITDMAMPKMTGAEIAREALQIRPDLPVILCTGYSADLNQQQAMEIGIHVVLQKPVQRTRFLRTIYQALA
ncbi:MAG TPA: hybrid sensor histidine kinase/response regulator [Desulfobulbaceae bacterium]|nr:hybrid sensor histidine kinase/response regulator [Desulfobulbaceae bacterium]